MLNTVLIYINEVTERENIPDGEYIVLAFDKLRATSHLVQQDVL